MESQTSDVKGTQNKGVIRSYWKCEILCKIFPFQNVDHSVQGQRKYICRLDAATRSPNMQPTLYSNATQSAVCRLAPVHKQLVPNPQQNREPILECKSVQHWEQHLVQPTSFPLWAFIYRRCKAQAPHLIAASAILGTLVLRETFRDLLHGAWMEHYLGSSKPSTQSGMERGNETAELQ